jgi:hypothetical protein
MTFPAGEIGLGMMPDFIAKVCCRFTGGVIPFAIAVFFRPIFAIATNYFSEQSQSRNPI